MRLRSSLALVLVAAASATASGCHPMCGGTLFSSGSDSSSEAAAPSKGGSSSGGYANAGSPANPTVAAVRAVTEADVVQLDHEQNRIYAMSKSGTLAVVDAATPGTLSLLGKTSLSGEPFEMYRRGGIMLAMANHGLNADGSQRAPIPDGAEQPAGADGDGALLTAIDVSDPNAIHVLSSFAVPGEIADSRIVGNVLYLATYENTSCWSCTGGNRTLVTTFDIQDATAPKKIDQVSFDSSAHADINIAWSTPWKRSIIATERRLYVGGLAADSNTTTSEGVIEVLDITDPGGKLTRGATISTSGPVMSRWQMDETDGVLRVISQRGAGRTQNGEAYPDIDTFRIESTSSMLRLGHTTLNLPRQEGLKTVRFDGTRAYAITFNQTDPLFTIDLADAAHPAQKGEIHMPGWVYHLEPRGNLLLGLGLDRNDAQGNLNLSLFDVTDLAAPAMVDRKSFGPTNMYEDYMITNGVMAEDQDRIQKAFRIFDDGLVAIPFSGAGGGYGTSACSGGGIQLFDYASTGLVTRSMLPVAGNPRRAIRRDSDTMKELIGVSDSNVTSFRIDDRSNAQSTADVVIGTCSPRSAYPQGGGGWEGAGDGYGGGDGSGYGHDGVYSGGRCE